MIPVSSWYCNDMVLTVFCLSGIVTILILAIFRKTFYLGPNCIKPISGAWSQAVHPQHQEPVPARLYSGSGAQPVF
jgi:hypothetical protein